MLLRLVVENRNGHVLVRAVGELDIASAPSVTTAAEDAFADGYRLLLLDLSGISFMDSTGLSALLALHREAESRDAHTATAHFQVNEASRELSGRLLLGLASETATL